MSDDIVVQGPDRIFSFPAGTSQDVMHQAITGHYQTLKEQNSPRYVPKSDQEAKEYAAQREVANFFGTVEPPYDPKLSSVTQIPLKDIPTASDAIGLKAGLPFSTSTESVKDILNAHVSGVKYSTDEFGNPIAIVNGQKYHIDPHGGNMLGFQRGVVQGGLGIGAGVLAGLALPEEAVGLGIYSGVQGATALANNLAQYEASRLAGNRQGYDPTTAAIETAGGTLGPAVGKVIGSAVKLFEPEAFASLSRGTQTWLKDLSSKFKEGKIPVPKDPYADLLFDTPEGYGAALRTVSEPGRPTSAAETVIEASQKRADQAPVRIQNDIDSIIGPHVIDSPEYAEALKASRLANSDELTSLLRATPPVPEEEVGRIVDHIDKLIPDSVGKVNSSLKYIRNMLTRDPSELEIASGQPIGKEFYQSSAQRLQNTIQAISNLIRNGGNAGGLDTIRPGELPALSSQVGQIRDYLSNILQKYVKNKNGNLVYDAIQGKYQNIYQMGDAYALGKNVLQKGLYTGDTYTPALVDNFLANPDTAYAIKMGARDAIQTSLGTSPNEVAALAKVPDREGNFITENLKKIFGKDTPSELSKVADREGGYLDKHNKLTATYDAARQASGAGTVEKTKKDAITGTIYGLPQLPFVPLKSGANRLEKFVRGQDTPRFYTEQGKLLTTPAADLQALNEGIQEQLRTQKLRNLGIAAGANAVPAVNLDTQREDGGRIERKSGGSVIDKAADALVGETMRNQKLLAHHTEQMLSMPDDAIVQALNIARSVAA